MKLLDRFLQYVKIDTQSQQEVEVVPSTDKQLVLSRLLCEQLREMGASDVILSSHGYVYATIPANNCDCNTTIGFIAHVDTSPAVSGQNVSPKLTTNYDGGDIVLSEGYTLSSKEYPLLKRFIGKTIITSDGTTLLGADDKAGVAEIMAMAETLLSDKSISHGVVKIAFTPDEEVGRGADFFDVEGFGCDYAYTVDGAILGEMDYENFNAASATIVVNGVSIHPGSAKGKMVNAILVLQELESMLPEREKPQYTEGYEGFYHLDSMSGNVNYCKGDYIIRDHDRQKFEIKKAFMQHCCESLNHKYGAGTVDCTIKDSYYNMKDKILSNIHLVDNAKLAMEKLGVEPIIMPIRGGTDGARLSFMGLPCPNLCAGGDNFHGRYEYIPYEDMETIVKILLNIVEIYSK